MNPSVDVPKLLSGDRRTIARAISFVENENTGAEQFLSDIFKHTGKAYRIGITGPPGAGKSTLTNKLAKFYRSQNLKIGIIAVDPTSPFTGGALLGDRVRMSEVEMDEGVFIRSMASRGSLGGLSKKTREAADILDAAGFDILLFETVGVGQSELDIAGAADTTVVVLVPESGDGIQAMKAGVMEIADFFVLNKADRPGAEQAVMSIKMILGFRPHDEHSWLADVVKSVANEGKGVEEIAASIERHKTFLQSNGSLEKKRSARMVAHIEEIIQNKFRLDFWNEERRKLLESKIFDVMHRQQSPYQIAKELLK
ncbi:MAG: methylmalonyl Co-A mutase-associated GTPase MeaB [Ignavibacteriales bacterium]|nr:methylmalonyl Co-A mutase-associated GTPase MeaB [Ignavibacteriales bacterium]